MTSWFKPNNRNNRPNDGISVQEQDGQPDTLLEFYRTMIILRRSTQALSLGGFHQVTTSQCARCLGYWRWDENDAYLIVFNFSHEPQTTNIDFTALPRPLRGVGQDLLRGGAVSIPSNGRYTSSIDANGIRILHW